MDTKDEIKCTLKTLLGNLNQKGYYLLIALSFLYHYANGGIKPALKWAIVLTACAVVLPLQGWGWNGDDPVGWLRSVKYFKLVMLCAAFVFTLRVVLH